MTLVVGANRVHDVRTQMRIDRSRGRWLLSGVLAVTLVVAAIAYATAPEGLSLATLILLLTCLAALAYAPVGVYLLVFLALIGDIQTAPWWPFTKNLSSRESMFFVDDRLNINPLEIVLAATIASWVMRAAADHRWTFRRGRMLIPLLVFEAFVVIGFLKGMATGGNRIVAVLEVRPLLYFPILYVLMTNVFTTRRQYRRVFGFAMVAVTIQSLLAVGYYRALDPVKRGAIEDLSEHTATITMNVLFLFIIALVAFKGSTWKAWAFGLLTPTVFVAYVLSQRRAAMVALFAGLMVLFGVLFYRRRAVFKRVAPVAVLVALVFIAATWNASGGLGLPATAVKTVFFPGSLGTQDAASDQYRNIEAYNLWFTIHSSPLTGFGFGQPFLVARPMPDISFFEFWQYLSHNSVLWIWIKTGYLGFVTMLYLFARLTQLGARSARRVRSNDDAALVTAALAYIVMFVVFAYVDIAWDIRPAVMLALCGALCADFERLDDDTVPPLSQRPTVTQRVALAVPQ